MRIAYVTVDPGIPVFGTKGASVHIQEVVRELIRRGHDVTVHTTRAGRDIPDDLAGLEVIETRIEADDPGARERAQQEVSARIAARIIAGGADAGASAREPAFIPPAAPLSPAGPPTQTPDAGRRKPHSHLPSHPPPPACCVSWVSPQNLPKTTPNPGKPS